MASNGMRAISLSIAKSSASNEQMIDQNRRKLHCQSTPVADISMLKKHKLSPISQPILGKYNPSLMHVMLILAIYLGLGTVCFSALQNQIKGTKTNGIIDSLYFCIVTMTTVGYGDLVPDSTLVKFLACVFVFTGMGIYGLIVSKAADYLVEKQEVLLVKALYLKQGGGAMEIKSIKVKYKFIVTTMFLVVLIIIGTVFMIEVEDLSLVDSFYCVCSTITTLGYGDRSFLTEIGRLFAVFWILTSTIYLAQFYFYVAELSTESRQQELVKWALTRGLTSSDLEAADLDKDRNVSPSEFVLYKLKEMGKIGEEDIAPVMEQFKKLDVDQSGALSLSDLVPAS